MALRAHVVNKYRTQPIDLQPYGNTISVEAPSDNPFEADEDVEVFTQASGGMAGPDPRHRSRGVLIARPQTTKHQGGQVRAFRTTMDAAHPGFMPGMGDLSTPRKRAAAPRHHYGFVPGMGDDPTVVAAPPAAAPSWLSAIQAAGQTAGSVLNNRSSAQIAASQAASQEAAARAEQARADQMRSQALMNSSLLARTGGNMAQHSYITYGLIAVAAVAVGVAIFAKTRK